MKRGAAAAHMATTPIFPSYVTQPFRAKIKTLSSKLDPTLHWSSLALTESSTERTPEGIFFSRSITWENGCCSKKGRGGGIRVASVQKRFVRSNQFEKENSFLKVLISMIYTKGFSFCRSTLQQVFRIGRQK